MDLVSTITAELSLNKIFLEQDSWYLDSLRVLPGGDGHLDKSTEAEVESFESN